MDDWAVTSETPAAPEFEDRWAPVEESSMDPWHVVQQAPVPPTPAGDMDFSAYQAFLNEHPEDPENPTWKDRFRAALLTPGKMLHDTVMGMATLPKRAVEAAQEDVAHYKERGFDQNYLPHTVGPAAETAMATIRPTKLPVAEPVASRVGKAAVEEALAPEWKPVNEEPVQASDTVRFYHGHYPDSPPQTGGGRWVTTDPEYARNFRAVDGPKDISYVDIPKGHPAEVGARMWDEIDEQAGTNAVDRYHHVELPEELAKQMKPVNEEPATTTLYRAEGKPRTDVPDWVKQGQTDSGHADAAGRWFTNDPAALEWYKKDAGPDHIVHSIEVPTADLEKYRVANSGELIAGKPVKSFSREPENEFFLPKELASQRKPLGIDGETPPPSPTAPAEAPPGTFKTAARIVKNILAPDEVSPMAEGAAADIRAAGGRAARDTETTRAAFGQESRKVNALPDTEKLGLIDYIENRSKENAPAITPELQPVADAIRTEMLKREIKIRELPSTNEMDFVEDYYPHMWQDPAKASDFVREFSSGTVRQGSGASLKKRTVPTIADGIAAGLKPISTDPLEVSMRYVQSMDRFIATQQVLDKAKVDGNIVYIKPRVMGASGNPDSFQVPPGWVPINGRGATNAAGAKAYAPADFARVYNNFIDAGIHRNADWGKVYDAARNTSNAVTSLELGLSGFHAATMAQEAMVNSVAKGIGELASGRPLSAAKSIISTPAKPLTSVLKGRQLEQTYLGKSEGTPLMRQITDLLTEAGGRAKGSKHAPDYQYTQASSYWDSFKKGSMLAEIKAAGQEIKAHPIAGPIKFTMQQVGRVMQTVAKPLFEYTIPKLKNGAFYDNMSSWLDANPLADHAAQVKAARTIWNSIDNRFGEMVSDNIFWNKTLKQSLQVALRSYSWTFGTIQELGGGAKALLHHPSSLSPKSPHYSPKAAYVIALPIVYATLNAAYQKMKTGKDPESLGDVMRGGLTGGTAPGVGGKTTVLERAMMPGYMKDVFGWWHDPVAEGTNKIATMPRIVKESITNKDWKDQPIRNVNDPTVDQVRQYLEYVYRSLGPITIKQLAKGQKVGSNISTGESLLGVRPAPSPLQDPQGLEGAMFGIHQRDWKRKENYDERQAVQYGAEPKPKPPRTRKKKKD